MSAGLWLCLNGCGDVHDASCDVPPFSWREVDGVWEHDCLNDGNYVPTVNAEAAMSQ